MITQRTLITHWKCFNIALFSNVKILCIVVKKNWCFCPLWNDRVDWIPKSILILTTSAELWQLIPIFISKRIDSNGKWRGLISMRTYSRNIRIRSIFISQGILKRTTGNGNMKLAHVHCDQCDPRQCHLSIVWTLPLNWVALIANQPLAMRAFSAVIAGARGPRSKCSN